MLKLHQPIDICSAQDLIAALMRQRYVHCVPSQTTRSTMERVLQDLETHRSHWQGFVLGPALPTTDWHYASGALVCLRDLGLGWNADTLYILSPDQAAAESMRTIAKHWDATEITTYSAARTQHLVAQTGVLTAVRWQASVEPAKKTDYLSIYSHEPPILLEQAQLLQNCSAQSLVAALMRRGQFGRFDPQQVLADLHTHASTWRSFLMGPELPEWGADLEGCLEAMVWLPQEWGGDHLYVWAWDEADAMHLRSLAQRWRCDQTRIIDGIVAAQLLNLPNAAPIVMFRWSDLVSGEAN